MGNSILFITDPFDSLKQEKDTSIFIMKEALRRDFEVFQCEMSDLTLKQKLSSQCSHIINNNDVLETAKKNEIDLASFSFCFMRKDPPVDQDFMNCLHLLNMASEDGANIINNPNAIKIFNEKIFAMEFSDLMPPTIISANSKEIEEFLIIHEEIVIKPLNGMGGENIHKASINDSESLGKIIDLTEDSKKQIIGQKF